MIRNAKSAGLVLVALFLIVGGAAMAPDARAETDDAGAVYFATVSKGCGDAGPGCGNLSIFRQQSPAGNEVSIALYHWKCLGFRGSPYKFRWIKSRVVETPSNRFSVKIDRPRIKLRLRGRFIGPAGSSSEVKGTLSLRNLNRKCGFRGAKFRQRETGPTTDPQG